MTAHKTFVWMLCITAFLHFSCTDTTIPTPIKKTNTLTRVIAPTSLRKAQTPEEVTGVLSGSVHSELDCSDCHPGQFKPSAGVEAQERDFKEARCDHCHEKEAAIYAKGIHARIEGAHGTRAAVCAQCHGDHDIYRVSDIRSRVAKRNRSSMCTACHESAEALPRLRANTATVGAHYLESIHGRALVDKGLNVAPACTDCHGSAHSMTPVRDPDSSVSPAKITETCGACHEGVLEQYRTSIHYAARKSGNLKAPVCTTCHTAHDIVATATNDFRLSSDQTCGTCHDDRRKRYLDTYHGKAHHLGDTRVAACYDCHGAHAINKTSDPRSSVSSTNRVATCRTCHKNASVSFVSFMPHADHNDRKNYPVLFWSFWMMSGLLLGTFAFFSLHTVLWFFRSMKYVGAQKKHESPPEHVVHEPNAPRIYTRFRPVDRFCHLLLVISFLTLVATGMPLKFHEAPWARSIFSALGGVLNAGRIHRLGAMLTALYFAIHLASLIGPIRRRSTEFRNPKGRFSVLRFIRFAFGPDSPIPNLQDLKDIAAHAKWFIGRGPKPTFDRFTYWEKFDYMAVFWGVTVIGISGLVMWFPIAASTLFPGWVINVAQVIHSDEALLAAGFIFTFHFFNSHFRPEKFPFDSVIFSGHISETEMQHDHGRQYRRLREENRLDALIADSREWSNWKWVFIVFGTLALVSGLVLAVAIFWALFHGGG
jgi:cytochrome b subunit of formate dehydrogenase